MFHSNWFGRLVLAWGFVLASFSAQSAELKYVEANGLKFAYVEQGAGPLVLLLHGYPETPEIWSSMMSVLAANGYRAVAPYMRGYSPTTAPADETYTVRSLGQDAVALIGALGAEKAIVIGHDWGASAAYAAAVQAPEKVSKLVVVSIPHPKTIDGDLSVLWGASHFITYQLPFAEWWLTDEGMTHVDTIYAKWASPGWTPPPALIESVKTSFKTDNGFHHALGYYWSFFGADSSQPDDLSPDSKFNMPTLAIAGRRDFAIDPSYFENGRDGFTGPYEVFVLDYSGHFPQAEEPEAFNTAVMTFLGPAQ